MADQRSHSDRRASPGALLEAARREERRSGRLKIFVGAAPGVGKTYEMLQQARARKQDGYDVAVGVVETHGRKETQALLDGFEIVPRKRLEYRGQSLEEMDLDALIARHPQIALVDELAHADAPGSRHPKRNLVCISEDPRAAGLVRYAKRLADRLHGPWTALYVEGRRALQLTEEERDRVADTLRLAEALGGEALTIPSADQRIVDDVIAYA